MRASTEEMMATCEHCGTVLESTLLHPGVRSAGAEDVLACRDLLSGQLKAVTKALAKRGTVESRLVEAIDDALNHHAARQNDPLRIPRWKSERIAALVNELACDWINVGLQMPKHG